MRNIILLALLLGPRDALNMVIKECFLTQMLMLQHVELFSSTEFVKTKDEKLPYVSLVVQLVVGEFELVKADDLPHPGVS